jgi:MinD superfamily P-loop ATPase
VRGSDYVLLVTEPTPFGLHDLTLAVETVRRLGLHFGVIINRADAGDDCVERYCAAEGISVLLCIPEERRIAEAYSHGIGLLDASSDLRGAFAALHESIRGTLGTR